MSDRPRLITDKIPIPNGKPLTPDEMKYQLILLTNGVNRLIEVVSENHVVAQDVTRRQFKRAGMVAAGTMIITGLSVAATILAIRGHLV